jgi:hypothetical protein
MTALEYESSHRALAAMAFDARALEDHYNALIARDTRPAGLRNRFSVRQGGKRTNILAVRVYDLAAAPPIVPITEPELTDAGPTKMGALTRGPLAPSAIGQDLGGGDLADCGPLCTLLGVSYSPQPDLLDRRLFPVNSTTVVFRFWWLSKVIDVTMSLLVSTRFNNPNDADIRPELFEKGVGFVISGAPAYFEDAYRAPIDAGGALGLTGAGLLIGIPTITGALASGKIVILCTSANPKPKYIPLHYYLVRKLNADGTATLQQPWYGGQDIIVPQSDLLDMTSFPSCQTLAFPATDVFAGLAPPANAAPTPAPTPFVAGNGAGLSRGIFPNSIKFTPTGIGMAPGAIDRHYTRNQVLATQQCTADYFSEINKGFILAPITGTYTLIVTANDGLRFIFNGAVVADALSENIVRQVKFPVALTAGQKYPIELDYFNDNNDGADGQLQLAWVRPDGVSEVIPVGQLFPE